MKLRKSNSHIILSHCFTGCDILFTIIFFLLAQTYETFQSDLPHPYRVTFSLPESSTVRHDPIDLVQLLRSQDLYVRFESTDKISSNDRALFEILDVSSNLLTSFQHRGQVNFLNFIDLHPMMGTIRFNVPIDRERICPDLANSDHPCKISILLAAYQLANSSNPESSSSYQDMNSNTQSGHMIYVELIIIILDVNDNAPYFAQLSSTDIHVRTIQIQEECPVGTMISLPMATDLDSAKNGIVKYEFHSPSTTTDIFEHFEIVSFRGTRIQCEDLKMHELVLDENRVLMKPDNLNFNSPLIPCLRVISRLDREHIQRFTFRLVVTDSGGKQGETVIRIQVRDINDHAPTWPEKLDVGIFPDSPVFINSERLTSVRSVKNTDKFDSNKTDVIIKYTYKVMECTRQRQLLHLTTTDLDSMDSENGRISYQMSEHTPDVDQIRQRLFVSSDYVYLTDLGLKGLSEANLTLIVTASDAAGKSNDAWILLMVQDCNDHKPMILMRTSEFSIPENIIGVSQLISLITVRDMDLVTSPNSEFTCSINDTTYLRLEEVMSGPKSSENMESVGESVETGDEHRSVLSRQGRWSIFRLETQPLTSFDRETASVHHVLLQCSDKGVPPLTSNMVINVNILDSNDNAPVFLIDEFNRPTSANPYTLAKHGFLGRKNMYSHSNSITFPSTRNQTAVYKYSIPENAQRGTIVGSVRAVDLDSGDNGRIIYEIVNVSVNPTELGSMKSDKGRHLDPTKSNEIFALSTNGDIQLINELDREQVDQYEILVRATDGAKTERLSSTATVLINVEDINDCRPQFEGEYVFEVVESYGSSTIHNLLGTIKAFDMDLGRNGSVTYHLAKSQTSERSSHSSAGYQLPGSHLVQISHDGKLSVYGVVDREKTPIIMVTVVAEDNGHPIRLSSSITVTIHVLDLNDNKPRFIESSKLDPNGDIKMNEASTSSADNMDSVDKANLPILSGLKLNLSLDTNIGTLLTVFLAYDPDNGPNGTLVYDLVYSGLPTTFTENKQNSLQKLGPSELDDNDQLPTFTLHPDGRLLLSKRLTYTDLVPNAMTQISKRYRRPDRLLVRVSDKGPQPEQSIITLQIFYYDPMDLIKSRNPSLIQTEDTKSLDALKSSSTENQPFSNFLTDPDPKSKYSHDQRLKSIHNSLIPSTRTTDRHVSRHVGLPIIYMLALAVCFALILVILSFICLYLKMRKNPSRNDSAKHYDGLVKLDGNNEGLLNCQNTDTPHMHTKHLASANLVKSVEDARTATICCPGSNSMTPVDYSIGSEHYRTLSPSYFVQNHMMSSPMLIKEPIPDGSMTGSRWTNLSPDYRTLPLSNIHEVFISTSSPNNCSIQDEFIVGNHATQSSDRVSDKLHGKGIIDVPNCRKNSFEDSKVYSPKLKIQYRPILDAECANASILTNTHNGTTRSKPVDDLVPCRKDTSVSRIIENLRLTKSRQTKNSGHPESTQLAVISSSTCSSDSPTALFALSSVPNSTVFNPTASSVSIAPSNVSPNHDTTSTFKPDSFKSSLWIENPNHANESLLDLENKPMNQLTHVTGSFV